MRVNNSWKCEEGNSRSDRLQEIRSCLRNGNIKGNSDLYGKLFEMGKQGRWEEVMWAIREAIPFSSTFRLH